MFKYDSQTLNDRIRDICDGVPIGDDVTWPFVPVDNTGKCIFYWGWFWRDVNFDNAHYTLCTNYKGENAGFCENNKWGYPSFNLTVEQSMELRLALEEAVDLPNEDNLRTAFNKMQVCIPRYLQHEASFA